MKRKWKMLVLLLPLLTISLCSTQAKAFPFIEVSGWVSPDDSTLVDNPDNTSTLDVRYMFLVESAWLGAEMDILSLEFEGDVFPTVNSFTVTSPGDWSVFSITSPLGNLYEISVAGTTLGVGEWLIADSNVTIYDWALTNISNPSNPLQGWSEGQIWGQSFVAGDTIGGGDGGSTAPVPEPSSILLLGSGLLGSGIVKWMRGRRVKAKKIGLN